MKTFLKALVITSCIPFFMHSKAINAEAITVTHWASGMYGTPFAVAMDKGFFKDAGIDVTGFIASKGGGTTVRNAMASDIPYGEVALPAAIAAIKQGVPLTIVHGGVISLADLLYVTTPDSNLKDIMDLEGKAIGYSSPKSVTDMVSTIALNNRNITDSVERKSVGGVSSSITSVQEGAVAATYIIEPSFSANKEDLKVLFRTADEVTNVTQTVGVVRTDYLAEHPEVIKAIIEGRRKGVEFIRENPEEAGAILAKHYKLDTDVTTSAINQILDAPGNYWSLGGLDYEGMDEMLKGLVLVGAIEEGPFDWEEITDESLLPDDLKTSK